MALSHEELAAMRARCAAAPIDEPWEVFACADVVALLDDVEQLHRLLEDAERAAHYEEDERKRLRAVLEDIYQRAEANFPEGEWRYVMRQIRSALDSVGVQP